MTDRATIDLFEVKNARDLFLEVQSAICEYHERPTSRLFLFLVFSLNHLREWIAGSGYEQLKKKLEAGIAFNAAEQFFWNIWDLPEFQIVNRLCNRSKHHIVASGMRTSVEVGFTVNSPVSDSLDQTYYLIDGVDSRDIFAVVIRAYHDWFREGGAPT